MIWIDDSTERFIKEAFEDRFIQSHYYYVKADYRWIRFKTLLNNEIYPHNEIHYELYNSSIELHFERNYDERYTQLIEFLMQSTIASSDYSWEDFGAGFRCRYNPELNQDNYIHEVKNFVSKFDELIKSFDSDCRKSFSVQLNANAMPFSLSDNVNLYHLKLREILQMPLHIPNYQRPYCWAEENVKCLLDDLNAHLESSSASTYRLGCIILYFRDKAFDIIDGQQRLITLTLLCSELGIDSSFLDEKIESSQSISFIAYNKSLIRKFCQRLRSNNLDFGKKLLKQIEFSVLILQNVSIDLAYTFFSSQNTRGVHLSDYDLLKAHHLRYIPPTFGRQAFRAAEVWDNMIASGYNKGSKENQSNDKTADYIVVLDYYLYNLRKWMRHLPGGGDNTSHRIKKEYEAAKIIEEIPPFGERFYFNEPIQGGSHFFAWVQKNVNSYGDFTKLDPIKVLRKYISWGSDLNYCNVIEAIAFAYFLKFGSSYLSEALMAIMRIVVQHRYEKARTSKSSVLYYSSGLNLIQMIDEATSPTFMLAESLEMARDLSYPNLKDMKPIQKSMRMKAKSINLSLKEIIVIDSFKTLNI